EMPRSVRIHYRRDHYRLEIDGEAATARAWRDASGDLVIELDGVRQSVSVTAIGDAVTVSSDEGTWRLSYSDPLAPRAAEAAAGGRLTAPMPGKIAQVLIKSGGTVQRGQALMRLEAMKMEHTIAAPADGTVERVNYAAGDLVEEGAELIVLRIAER